MLRSKMFFLCNIHKYVVYCSDTDLIFTVPRMWNDTNLGYNPKLELHKILFSVLETQYEFLLYVNKVYYCLLAILILLGNLIKIVNGLKPIWAQSLSLLLVFNLT